MPTSGTARKILLVEDDAPFALALQKYVAKFGFDLVIVSQSSEAEAAVKEHGPCCLLLDCMLPGGPDGLEVCRRLRAEGHTLPIIFTTARGELSDRVAGLELGADDFLPKPFDPRELVARICAVLRRAETPPPRASPVLAFEGLSIDVATRVVTVDGTTRGLSDTEYGLLEFMARHPGEILDRDTLIQQLRGITWKYGNRSIDMTVSRLRLKLNDPDKSPRFIRTVRGTGYLFVAKALSRD